MATCLPARIPNAVVPRLLPALVAAIVAVSSFLPVVRAGEGPVAWMLVAGSGRPAALARDGLPALKKAGLRATAGKVDAAPKVLIIYPRALNADSELGLIQQILREGAGLVLIYSLSSDLQEITQKLLEPWGVELSPARLDSSDTLLADHPVTAGLDKFFVWRVPANLKGLTPLIKQGQNVIAGVSTKTGSRLVVLPLDAVVPGQESDTIPARNLQLLTQAATWAAGRQPAPASATQPPEKPAAPAEPAAPAAPQPAAGSQGAVGSDGKPLAKPAEPQPPAEAQPAGPQPQPGPTLPSMAPTERGSYAKTAYIDITAADEDWPVLAAAARVLAESAGLHADMAPKPRPAAALKPGEKPKPVDPRDLPLVRVLHDNPALVILGSCREYDEAEALALSTYVVSGGAVLALPRGTERSNPRMVWLNAVLEKFGAAATLGRPGGTVRLDSSVINLGVDAIGAIPPGALMVGYRGSDIAYVGAFSAARVASVGAGRVAFLDPLPWVQPDPKADPAKAWRSLTAGVIRWLLFGMKLPD